VQEALEDLESDICGECDVCEVKAEVRDTDGSLELFIEAFAEDFLCLPSIESFEEVVSTILKKAGIQEWANQ